MTAWRPLLLALVTGTLAGVGCGGGGTDGQLNGSVTQTYNLDFDRVDIYRQNDTAGALLAVQVKYVYRPDTAGQRWPVIVTANAPLAAGQEKQLTGTGGDVRRVMDDQSEFPKMKTGKIIFDELSEVGQPASGKFYITFEANPSVGLKTEGTLNGEFDGTLRAFGTSK
jgi:hypothetical protein